MKEFNTLHYVLAFLKKYNIAHIIMCPGTQNSTFNLVAAQDDFFKCYSVVDERSAGYVAVGMASQIGKPVVITCTGATASRNFLSSLTEAFYSKIPVIALTFYNRYSNKFALSPQYLDRSVSQNDIKSLSVHLSEITDPIEKRNCLININAALCQCVSESMPVHINCPSSFNYDLVGLPQDVWKTEVILKNYAQSAKILTSKKVAIFIGRHNRFPQETITAISDFAEKFNALVICEHASNYTGKNKILLTTFHYIRDAKYRPEVIIDLGGINSLYTNGGIFNNVEYWTATPLLEYFSRYHSKLRKMFVGPLDVIFKDFITLKPDQKNSYYTYLANVLNQLASIDLPLSTPYVARELGKRLPRNCILHAAILQATQDINFCNISEDIYSVVNSGGFGIDGALSTAFGQALVTEENVYCFCGDLAFFYDMNILGNRHLKPNMRILLVNNNMGFTMRADQTLERHWHEQLNDHVTAAFHYKNGAKKWAEDCGFDYLSARTKEELQQQFPIYLTKNAERPVLLEVFTTVQDEKEAMHRLFSAQLDPTLPPPSLIRSFYNAHKQNPIVKNLNTVRKKCIKLLKKG